MQPPGQLCDKFSLWSLFYLVTSTGLSPRLRFRFIKQTAILLILPSQYPNLLVQHIRA